MEPLAPIPFPAAADVAEDIALVSAGAAVRVRVAGIEAGIADAIAEAATARTRAARVALTVEPSPEATTFTVGPRLSVVGPN